MMTNLFSSFDPCSSIMNLSLNWLSTMICLFMVPCYFWFIPSRFNIMWLKIMKTLHKEFKTILGPFYYKGTSIIFISLFSMILFNNFMGLFPYIYTSSSHLSMTLSLAFPLWLSMMIFGWLNNTNLMFSHLVPQGTPPILMPFMVCIESISNLIRPMTLAVRLSANMIAGHLLLTLLGNLGPNMNINLIWMIIFLNILLLILEFAVSIIQSYVFSILSTLYCSEIN